MSILNKVSQLSQSVLDRVTGAEVPKLYFNRQGEMTEILNNMPLLQEKYRPTPWLSNSHVHLLYFDVTVAPFYPVSDAGLKIAAHFYNHNMYLQVL